MTQGHDIAALARGERRAIAALYDEVATTAWRLALAICSGREQAEQAIERAFARLPGSLADAVDGPGSVLLELVRDEALRDGGGAAARVAGALDALAPADRASVATIAIARRSLADAACSLGLCQHEVARRLQRGLRGLAVTT